jgi:plastocyanin
MLTVLLAFLIVPAFSQVALAGDIVGKITVKGARHAGDAVVYIDEIPGKEFPPPKEPALMDQLNMAFVPHVLPVVAGTKVNFRNSDDVLHNVFTPDKCADKFNLGSWAKGEMRPYTFEKAGCVAVILCNVHPEMEAYVVTLQNPYFAVTDKEGNFVIKDVPEGKYTLKVWHEKLKTKPQEVTVPKEGKVEVSFLLKR